MNNNIKEFAEKNVAGAALNLEIQRKNMERNKDMILAMAGINEEEFEIVKDKILSLDEETANNITVEEAKELLGAKIIDKISKTMKIASIEKQHQFVIDFLLTIRAYDQFDKGVEEKIEELIVDNQKFTEELTKLAEEFKASSKSVRDELLERIETAVNEKESETAITMLRAYDDTIALKFLNNMNIKRVKSIMKDRAKYNSLKTKVAKMYIKNNMPLKQFDQFEIAIMSYLYKQYPDIDTVIANNLAGFICVQIFTKIGSTKYVDVYKKAFMSYVKNMIVSLTVDKNDDIHKKLGTDEFRKNLTNGISLFLDQ